MTITTSGTIAALMYRAILLHRLAEDRQPEAQRNALEREARLLDYTVKEKRDSLYIGDRKEWGIKD